MKEILFMCIIFAITYSTTGQAECNTPDGGFGICKDIGSCPELLKIAAMSLTHPALLEKLIPYKCTTGTNQVCCPDCYTPKGKAGVCKPATECNHILDMAQNPSESDIYYLGHSVCDGKDANLNVCCGSYHYFSPRNTESCLEQMTAFPPLPDSDCCGVEATSSLLRNQGGNMTEIDKYPWLVLLEYRQNNKTKLYCAGALISGKYVLTAAQCVSSLSLKKKLISVRVGEYDIDTAIDCVLTPEGNKDCAPPALSVPIEDIIAHPKFNRSAKLHDIALLRLKEAVQFSDFVRPICLPSSDMNELLFPTMKKPIVAGWSRSKYKKAVAVPFVRMQYCQDIYSNLPKIPSSWSERICAGGELGKDSCKGDGGAPLMYTKTREDGQDITEVVGIVSLGYKPCGTENKPGIYTKVVNYIPWIRANIKP